MKRKKGEYVPQPYYNQEKRGRKDPLVKKEQKNEKTIFVFAAYHKTELNQNAILCSVIYELQGVCTCLVHRRLKELLL